MVPVPVLVALVSSALGLIFASVSTYDFAAHLDRQVHGLHCSLLPGIGTPDISGASGCHVTLMSPYSSVLRESVWGGIPISLPAMAVFAFLLFWGALLVLLGRTRDVRATGFYALASLVPTLTSLVMAGISLSALDALCKVCLGIYLASFGCSIGAYLSYRNAQNTPDDAATQAPLSNQMLGLGFVLGCCFVGVSLATYAAAAPNFERFVGACGKLEKADASNVLIPLGGPEAGPQVIEVLDPLCAACRAFERRFSALSLAEETRRMAMLFPLDNACNWMVESAVHPGACAISEAMLCAGDAAHDVLSWAFEEQETIMEAERAGKGSAQKLVSERFPAVAGCIGTTKTKARLNKALRWAVDNRLPVLTPQLYVNGTRLCDADTDLGLDYMLSRLVETTSGGTR